MRYRNRNQIIGLSGFSLVEFLGKRKAIENGNPEMTQIFAIIVLRNHLLLAHFHFLLEGYKIYIIRVLRFYNSYPHIIQYNTMNMILNIKEQF